MICGDGRAPVINNTHGLHTRPPPGFGSPLYFCSLGASNIATLYGGTALKYCMFHKRGWLPLSSAEHTKLRSCTSVLWKLPCHRLGDVGSPCYLSDLKYVFEHASIELIIKNPFLGYKVCNTCKSRTINIFILKVLIKGDF